MEDGGGVDVEGLGVEGEGPEVVFARGGGRRGGGCREEARASRVGLDFRARGGCCVEVWIVIVRHGESVVGSFKMRLLTRAVEFKVLLEVGMA